MARPERNGAGRADHGVQRCARARRVPTGSLPRRAVRHARPLPEAFAAKGEPVAIPAALLRERLPETIKTAIERERLIYGNRVTKDAPIIRAFSDFVELCERKEGEAGQPCAIRASY
jgi:hypothetical protein